MGKVNQLATNHTPQHRLQNPSQNNGNATHNSNNQAYFKRPLVASFEAET